ncbi:hypothetical protein RvY_02040 [Ramazzottius varieornatus]|uniref:Guanylate cyclase domain-containing protein n=1 Tax=Ramazzottius varieornatus TaxID=947166 RepID=A0A1D1UT02_RAMVA|nr:hypothetical protein RvY_02040 [Ramazzottius varieornatus]
MPLCPPFTRFALAAVLIVLPVAHSAVSNFLPPDTPWSSPIMYLAGVASTVLVMFLLLHCKENWFQRRPEFKLQIDSPPPSPGAKTKSILRSLSRPGSSGNLSTQGSDSSLNVHTNGYYPKMYLTASRPGSVNVKPMLRLATEMQSFVERMDQYTDNLESLLAEKTSELKTQKAQLDGLLSQLLPIEVARKFMEGERVAPMCFQSATVYFADIAGYMNIVNQSTAVEMVEFLNALYRMSDAVVANYDAYKVETIGDADLIASGIPVPNGKKHASELAKLSLQMSKAFDDFRIPHRPNEAPRIRIGLHTGHCCAGIVGTHIPKYVLFGDAVSTATKLEGSGLPGRVHISGATAEILTELGGFVLERRGEIQIKGKKNFETFWVNGLTGDVEEPQ